MVLKHILKVDSEFETSWMGLAFPQLMDQEAGGTDTEERRFEQTEDHSEDARSDKRSAEQSIRSATVSMSMMAVTFADRMQHFCEKAEETLPLHLHPLPLSPHPSAGINRTRAIAQTVDKSRSDPRTVLPAISA